MADECGDFGCGADTPTIPIDPTTPSSNDVTKGPKVIDSSKNASENIIPAVPIWGRVATTIFAVPFFELLDTNLVALTEANTVALALDPEPGTKAVLLITEIIFSGADLVSTSAKIDYVHWIVTGRFIKSWGDLQDWTMSP
jgi:hypothetical protein